MKLQDYIKELENQLETIIQKQKQYGEMIDKELQTINNMKAKKIDETTKRFLAIQGCKYVATTYAKIEQLTEEER